MRTPWTGSPIVQGSYRPLWKHTASKWPGGMAAVRELEQPQPHL